MAVASLTATERIIARRLACLVSGGERSGGDVTQDDAETYFLEVGETISATDLASTANGEGAALVGVEDAGAFTTATDVEAALAEIYQHIISTQASVAIPMGANWFEVDGTALAAFADGASTTPGLALDGSEAAGIRWNNHATPDPICTSVLLPYDLDGTAAVTLNVLAHKTGATLADAVTWEVTAFIQQDGALYDADADLGGTSSAMTGDATSKTSQLETLTLAAGDIPDTNPAMLTLTIQPTDGTLGTDDVTITGMWLTYTRKLLTS